MGQGSCSSQAICTVCALMSLFFFFFYQQFFQFCCRYCTVLLRTSADQNISNIVFSEHVLMVVLRVFHQQRGGPILSSRKFCFVEHICPEHSVLWNIFDQKILFCGTYLNRKFCFVEHI